MNPLLLDVVACPRCLAKLHYDKSNQRLICRYESLAYPIQNVVPQLIAEQAKFVDLDQIKDK